MDNQMFIFLLQITYMDDTDLEADNKDIKDHQKYAAGSKYERTFGLTLLGWDQAQTIKDRLLSSAEINSIHLEAIVLKERAACTNYATNKETTTGLDETDRQVKSKNEVESKTILAIGFHC